MYIQITDHCNMTCSHCCFSCSPRKKRFMTPELFKLTTEMLGDDLLTIGGGEPTTHPKFFEILAISMSFETPLIITNGSIESTSLILNQIAKAKIIYCELSRDYYHSEISNKVVKAFTQRGAIRNVTHGGIVKSGRAARNGIWQIENRCVCEDIFIDPDGDIYSCGCKTIKLGNVITTNHEVVFDKLNILGMFNSRCVNELSPHERREAINNIKDCK